MDSQLPVSKPKSPSFFIAVGVAVVTLVAITVIAGAFIVGMKNNLVAAELAVDADWAQVDGVLQRRADLIPNLVSSAKGFAKHEKEILEQVAKSREAYVGAATPQARMGAANELGGVLSRLMVVMENYPTLKADAVFVRLMDELAGTENRIAVERMRYNKTVQAYNTKLRQFPYTLVAGGRPPKPFFEAAPSAKDAPKVEF
jgi:LemA protein